MDIANVGNRLQAAKLVVPLLAACSREGAGDNISQRGIRVCAVRMNPGHVQHFRISSDLSMDLVEGPPKLGKIQDVRLHNRGHGECARRFFSEENLSSCGNRGQKISVPISFQKSS